MPSVCAVEVVARNLFLLKRKKTKKIPNKQKKSKIKQYRRVRDTNSVSTTVPKFTGRCILTAKGADSCSGGD